jgi:2-hydroxycyclohexanecarboxyl-CoA dehydrogenase
METPKLLEGQVAVVTGGAAGIGGGISRVFAAAGAHVVLNDVDAELADTARADIETAGGAVTVVVGDIRERATVELLRDTAVGVDGGRVDVLVNNVGDFRPNGWFLDTDDDHWDGQYAITLQHVFRCTKAFLPIMVEQGRGAIVNNSTVEAFRGIPRNTVYSAFNAGVVAFTRSLAVEFGKHGVRVNAIAPDMANTLQTPADMMLHGRDPALLQAWIPLGRFGEPEDYGRVVLFLASDLSGFVTGLTIPVDGGTLAAGGWYGRASGRGFTNLPDQP